MIDFEVAERGTLKEVQLARELGRVIHDQLQQGNSLPPEVIRAYKELHHHWQWQIEEGHP